MSSFARSARDGQDTPDGGGAFSNAKKTHFSARRSLCKRPLDVETNASGTHALVAVLLVTASNSLLGALIATFLYGGITGAAAVDYVVVGLLAAGRNVFSASFLARIPANLVDKGIAVFAAFILLQYLTRRFRWSSASERSRASP